MTDTLPSTLETVEGASMAIPVGVYARISEDSQNERGGVTRQEADGRALAALRRWHVARVYVDNDLSAYQKDVVRPEFEQMLSDLAHGVIEGVIVYNIDRGFRQPRDLERAIDIYDERPDYVFATLEGDINLATIDGRTMARVMVAFANKSSADTGRRVKRKQAALAHEGKPHGGRQAYGWREDGVTVDPEAQAEILAAHQAILAGARISQIREDWISRGLTPTAYRGKKYQGPDRLGHRTVRQILTNPALAGRVVYRGEIVRDASGAPVRAVWDPVCTEGALDAVVLELERRHDGADRRGARRYLLSGIARCGVCGIGMRGSMRRRANKEPYPVYMCGNSGYGNGCGKVARSASPVDELIKNLVIEDQEARKSANPPPLPGWGKEPRLQVVLQEIGELYEAKLQGKISVSSLLHVIAPLERERDALQAEKRRLKAKAERAKAIDIDFRESWDRLPLEVQRTAIYQTLEAVVIHPAGRGVGRKFNPDLIEPIWA